MFHSYVPHEILFGGVYCAHFCHQQYTTSLARFGSGRGDCGVKPDNHGASDQCGFQLQVVEALKRAPLV